MFDSFVIILEDVYCDGFLYNLFIYVSYVSYIVRRLYKIAQYYEFS